LVNYSSIVMSKHIENKVRGFTNTNYISRSWPESSDRYMTFDKFPVPSDKLIQQSTTSNIVSKKNNIDDMSIKPNHEYKPYDAMNNCKSAGIIPYTIHNDTVYFLFQRSNNPLRRKDMGWNDFGGKHNYPGEKPINIAAREFSEETSCLFYLKEISGIDINYQLLKNNHEMKYDDTTVEMLRNTIPISQKYYYDKIAGYENPIYVSSKETYISYFVNVEYIPAEDLPLAEDIHIDYQTRYLRECCWISLNDIRLMSETDFHKRLQITRVRQRIINYYENGLFTAK
jgi:8-oxo-dGTP pyrophosphatase MutT (NUDIX family)